MGKRLISFLCALMILISAGMPMLILGVAADELSTGSYPYLKDNDSSVILRNTAEGEIEAYSDFVAKSTLDSLTDENYMNTWRIYNRAASEYIFNSKVLAGSALEKYSVSSDNVYGNSGNSIKISYTKSCNSKITPSKGAENQYFHFIRQNVSFSIPNDYIDSASISFWVKTEYKAYIVLRLTCNGQTEKDFIISERITVPEGESIIEIPLSNFMTCNDGFNSINASGSFKVNIADIYFKSTESFENTRDIYFDNLGFNFYTSNSTKALHNEGFVLKNNLESLAYSFDNNKDKIIDGKNISWTDDTYGNLAVATDPDNIYGGTGNAIKYTTESIYSSNKTNYNYINSNGTIDTKIDGVSVGKDAVLCLWIKSDRALSVYIRGIDSSWTQNRYRSGEYFVPAGESILEIPFSDITIQDSQNITCDFQFTWEKLNSLGIYFKSATLTDVTGTKANLFIDQIGIKKGEVVTPGPEIEPVPDTVVTHREGFKEVELLSEKWVNKKSENAVVVTENISEHYHSGITNVAENKSALKVSYNNLDSSSSNVAFYYDTRLRLNTLAPYIYEEDSVISFWVWSDQSVNLKITYMDYDVLEEKSVQCAWKTVTVPAGESIVEISMKEMAKDGQTLAYSYANQLQIVVLSNEESNVTNGNLYIDAVGFYDSDPENDVPHIPEDIKPEIPDKKEVHGIGFSEIELDSTLWINKKSENAIFAESKNSEHYHSGKTNIGNNNAAWQITYSNLSDTANNVNFYYNDGIRISKTQPYIYGDTSVLSFWVYSEQSVNIKISYMDYSVTASKSIACKPITVTVNPGENIVKIPMKELAADGNEMQYRHCYQLQFAVFANSNTYATSSKLWIDAIGFYDSALVINDKPLEIPQNTYVWWNFDKDDSLEDLGNEWATRFEGEGNKGISLSIENNSENVYGGKGNSLKIVYDRRLGTNSIPCIWHETRMTAYGDGIVFWIKSEEKTNIRLVCNDADAKAVKVDAIPVTIGYNIISVKWSDFEYMDTKMTGTPNMSSIGQLQIRPNGCNNGTLWIDQIGFSNVSNDGTNAYYSLYPPTQYKKWHDGVSVVGEDFEGWPGDDDMKFCSEWYFEDTGWISLVKNNNNTMLKMDYDFSKGKKSVLMNTTQFTEVDPAGGISFWAKSSEERYYTLKVWLGEQVSNVIIKGSTEGRYYKIPFSAFWMGNKIDTSYKPQSASAVTVQRISFVTDNSCNPPAMNISDQCTLWLDDIKFVDSASYKRATAVEHYENGVCLKAPVEAFDTGVTVKIDSNNQSDNKELLSVMKEVSRVGNLYKIEAFDIRNITVTPQVEVELIFDVPEGEKAENIVIYQRFIDGSLSKRKGSIGDDGKVHLKVYRLGEYVMAFSDGENKENADVDVLKPEQKLQTPWFAISVSVGAAIVICAVVGLILLKKRGVKK